MLKTCVILASILLLALCASGQTFTLGLAGGGYMASTPHSAGVLTIDVTSSGSAVSSRSVFEMRPLSVKTPEISTRTGVKYIFASKPKVNLFGLADVGLANGAVSGTTTATALAGATGGGIDIFPFSAVSALGFSITAEGVGTSAELGGWNPLLTVGVSYQFNGVGSLASRKAALKYRKTH